MANESVARLMMVNLDCGDPPAMASFYSGLLGWDVTHSEGDYAMISNGSTAIGFGRVDDFTPPSWPDESSSKRYHLDFEVDDVEMAQQASVALGASVPEFQPGGESWRVLIDPQGHPYCICPKSS